MPEAARLVESQIKDHFDLFLSSDTNAAEELLEWIIEKAEERKRKKDDRELIRKSTTRKLRQQGKLSEDDDPVGGLRKKVKDPKKFKNYNLFAELGIDRKYLGVPFTKLPKYIQEKLVHYEQKERKE